MLKVITMVVGHLETNCYLAYCDITRQAAVIDPGGEGEDILARLAQEKLQVVYIINTHGHADHIAANGLIHQATGAKICIHAQDAPMLTDAAKNLAAMVGIQLVSISAHQLLTDNDLLTVGQVTFQVLHTPGHTLGGICLLAEDILFAGDTLFRHSVGRTDLPRGSLAVLQNSINTKLMVLADQVKVLPGHGPETTIGDERRNNPFI